MKIVKRNEQAPTLKCDTTRRYAQTMGGPLDEFFKKKFFRLLGKKKRSKNKPSNAASQRLEQLGFTIEPAFARLLDFVETHDVLEIGPLGFFEIDDVIADGKNSLEFLLVQPFRVDAALLHAFPLGTTGSGDLWFVPLAPHHGKHEVFLFGHDTGAVELAADSLEALVFAAHLTDRDTPATAAERRALVGHVKCSDDLELDWLGTKPLAKSAAPLPRLLKRTSDLRALLNGYSERRPAAAAKLPANPLPAETLDALLRAFLRGEDKEFQPLTERFASSPSGLVRDAVAYLEKLAAKRGPATFARRKALLLDPAKKAAKAELDDDEDASDDDDDGDWKKEYQAAMAADRAGVKARKLQKAGDHRQAVKYFKQSLDVVPEDGDLWAAYSYSLFCLERWAEMRDAAEHAIEEDDENSYAYQQLACACDELGDTKGALRAGRQAIELDPKNADAMYNLAVMLLRQRKREGRSLLEPAGRLKKALRKDAAADADVQKALAALD